MRPTDKNINRIKEELIALKGMNDSVKNSLISHSQINKDSRLLADKAKNNNPAVA